MNGLNLMIEKKRCKYKITKKGKKRRCSTNASIFGFCLSHWKKVYLKDNKIRKKGD